MQKNAGNTRLCMAEGTIGKWTPIQIPKENVALEPSLLQNRLPLLSIGSLQLCRNDIILFCKGLVCNTFHLVVFINSVIARLSHGDA